MAKQRVELFPLETQLVDDELPWTVANSINTFLESLEGKGWSIVDVYPVKCGKLHLTTQNGAARLINREEGRDHLLVLLEAPDLSSGITKR